MQSFLEEVANQCLNSINRPEDLIFVLPSKRAGSFLRQILVRKVSTTTFSPGIYSIEDFVEHISGLSYSSNTQLLFDLYQAYLHTTPKGADSFNDFCKWGQTLLQDFNEIDRYLVPAEKLFSYLADVKKIEQWALTAEKTPMMEGYIRFWNGLKPIYDRFGERLLREERGYQGLVYKKACDALSPYLEKTRKNKHIFLGFNALNKAEATIIQEILNKGKGEIFWDADPHYLEDPVHEAGYFIRKHRQEWNVLAGKPLKGTSSYYKQPKNIQITGIPRSVAQMKYAGKLLKDLRDKEIDAFESTALVLGDEALLNPLLHSIPQEVSSANITMGYPLQKTSLEALFSQLFELHLQYSPRGWFFKNVLALVSHPLLDPLFTSGDENHLHNLQHRIKSQNWVYLTPAKLKELAGFPTEAMELLFFKQEELPRAFLKRCLSLIEALRTHYQDPLNPMVLEQLYRFYTLFNQLDAYVLKYRFVTDIKTLFSLYKTLVATETIDFRGEPLQGLQIMGMLESRNLDFETVIITSVNEGILPAGKSNNSFIPYDLKREFGLPTYKEKDAVYAYHFYRLLQRATNIYLLYNTEPDALEGGEKSRLIAQLLTDKRLSGQISHIVAGPEVIPDRTGPITVPKDQELLAKLRALAVRGFSPSSLTNYIRNPIDFYKKSILGIDEALEVEESITTHVFGTVVHGALEDLYRPFIGQYLKGKDLRQQRSKIKEVVKSHFEKAYSDSDIFKGKNLIAFNVLTHYIERLLEFEINSVEKNSVKLIALEEVIQTTLAVPGLDFPVKLRGIIDRVDLFNDTLRIIDYKTGKVIPANVEVRDWEELTENYDRSKAFQLLTYATMYQAEKGTTDLQAGIISVKNLNSGVFHFSTTQAGDRAKDQTIGPEVLAQFRKSLHQLLLQIFDPSAAFVEKPV